MEFPSVLQPGYNIQLVVYFKYTQVFVYTRFTSGNYDGELTGTLVGSIMITLHNSNIVEVACPSYMHVQDNNNKSGSSLCLSSS